MKLTPVQLYTVNHHGADALPEDVAVWAASPEEAATQFLLGVDVASGRMVHVMRTGLDISFRIDPNPVTLAPAQGWVKGPPPKDGEWRVVAYNRLGDGTPSVGVARWDDDARTFHDDGGAYYSATITHHIPTPIQPPKES